MSRLAIAAACVAIALLSFFQFPGHTWLHEDSQIYVPILEHLQDPSALRNELLASKPHVAYTLYDEVAVLLRDISGMDFRTVLAAQQIAARAFGIWGLYLIALALLGATNDRKSTGISRKPDAEPRPGARLAQPLALFVAAVCSLGAVVSGPSVLTVEYEPTPRAFALPLVLCAVGLVATGRILAAGLAGGVALVFHAPTALPFWALFAVLQAVYTRRTAAVEDGPAKTGRPTGARLRAFLPLAVAATVLILAARRQEAGAEAQAFFAQLTPFLEDLQRMRASYNWISSWEPTLILHYVILSVALVIAYVRVGREGGRTARIFLLGLPALGMVSMPVSWLLLERWKWALVPQFQPMRLLLYVTLFAQLLAAVAGVRAALRKQVWEAVAWFALAYLVTIQPIWTEGFTLRAAALAVGLGGLAWAAALTSRRSRWALALGVAAFFAAPAIGQIENYPALHTPELAALSRWARGNTPRDSVFLFADAGRSREAGIFRAQALRAVYVDWKGGGQVNYLADFAGQWWNRWQLTLAHRYRPSEIPKYDALGIQYVVLQPRNRMPRPAEFQNGRYLVYKTLIR